ncbi:hypothetical protein PENSPDRAFT_649836 [Peniophora sp. CONT]|nr:hypothetical protein PENSPDRAFT_649836 [Peniophora sp. CONT]
MIFRTRYVLHIPTSEGGWSPDDHHTMLGSIFRGNWGDGKLALLRGGAEPVTAEKFLQYGMEDVLSGRPAPEALVTLLGALWQGFARQHGPFDTPPTSYRDEPENKFSAATILEVFHQALDSDGWFGDDGALQCNIVKAFRLRLPVDTIQRVEALSAHIAEEAADAAAPASMATGQREPVTGGVQRAKRGREDDEKENEEPEVAGGDVSAKRRRKD